MHFLRFLKLSTDARHTQSYSPPFTVSGNTSTVFKKSKTGSSALKKRQWWEASTGSTTPLKRKRKYSQNSISNRLGNISKKEVINLQPTVYDCSSIILKHLDFSESTGEIIIAYCIDI